MLFGINTELQSLFGTQKQPIFWSGICPGFAISRRTMPVPVSCLWNKWCTTQNVPMHKSCWRRWMKL